MTDVVVTGSLEGSPSMLEHRCLVLLAEEQEQLLPNNALIAVLCDTVRFIRLAREICNTLQESHRGGPLMPIRYSYADQLAEAKWELAMRKHVYTKKQHQGVPVPDAERHLAVQAAIVQTLERLALEEAGQGNLFAQGPSHGTQ